MQQHNEKEKCSSASKVRVLLDLVPGAAKIANSVVKLVTAE
jgi:hypothetical protein